MKKAINKFFGGGVAPISNNYILQYFSGSDRKSNGQYI